MDERHSHRVSGRTLRLVIESLCFLLALGFLTANLGQISPQLNSLLAVLLLGVIVTLNIGSSFRVSTKSRLWGVSSLLMAIGAWLFGGSPERCLAVAFLFLSLGTLRTTREGNALSVYSMAAAFASLYLILYQNVPQVFRAIQESSHLFSLAMARLTGQSLLFGATASGFNILILFLLLALSFYCLAKGRSWKLLVVVSALAVLADAAYLIVHGLVFIPILGLFQNRYHLGHSHYHAYPITALNTTIFFLLLLAVPAFFLLRDWGMRAGEESAWSRRLVAACSLVLLGAFAVTYVPAPGKPAGKVLLFQGGYLNWDKPVFGKYGERSGGMFGMLPDYLTAIGFEVKPSNVLSDDELADCGAVVLINLNSELSQEETECIWRFVGGGGSLLALGDHTGLAGIREPFNSLLRPVGIEFNFDSAHYLKEWDYGFEVLPHQATWGIKPDRELGISVGASLKVAASVRPLIVGKYAFSDTGNANNNQNAFLGDRSYNPGELLGDVILAAATTYGRGKVVVFGDTSTFQNVALVTSYGFVQRIFDWLTTHTARSLSYVAPCGLLLLVIGLALVVLPRGAPSQMIDALAVPLLAGLMLSLALSSIGYDKRLLQGNIAYVDNSHLERIDYSYGAERSLLGLSYNLMRNGYLPVEMSEFSRAQLRASSLFISQAPALEFSGSELRTLNDFMKRGGSFLLSAGWDEAVSCRNVLTTFGLSLDNVPLGPVEPQDNSARLHFYNAWPVIAQDPETTEVVCSLNSSTYPIIVKQACGSGRFVFVADAGFFTSANLESFDSYYPENIAFLKNLLRNPSAELSAIKTGGVK